VADVDGDEGLVGEIEGFDLFEGGGVGYDLRACAGQGFVVDQRRGLGLRHGAGLGEPAGEVGQILVCDGGLAVADIKTDVADGTGIAMAILEGNKSVAVGPYAVADSVEGLAVGYKAEAGADRAVAIGPQVSNQSASSFRLGWGNAAGEYMHMGDFSPNAGTPAASHFIPVTLNGATYKILLSNA